MSGSIIPPARASDVKLYGYDGTSLRSVKVDSSGNIAMNAAIDFSGDMEIITVPVTNRAFTPASSGSNSLIVAGAAQYLKLFKVFFSTSADITGVVELYIGAKYIGGFQNPRVGGQWLLLANQEKGALGEDLTCTLPSATAITINVSYDLIG